VGRVTHRILKAGRRRGVVGGLSEGSRGWSVCAVAEGGFAGGALWEWVTRSVLKVGLSEVVLQAGCLRGVLKSASLEGL
jgi:hypothetical protein